MVSMRSCRVGIDINGDTFLSKERIDINNYKIDINDISKLTFFNVEAGIFFFTEGKTIKHGDS